MTLIEILYKLDGPDREVDGIIAETFGFPQEVFGKSFGTDAVDGPDMHYDAATWSGEGQSWSAPYFTASVDACLTLAERVLPGWRVENLCEWENETLRSRGPWTCDLRKNGENFFSPLKGKCSNAPSPAIALCIAILRAKEASHGE